MHTIKFVYRLDESVFIIVGNVQSCIYCEDHLLGDFYNIEFPDDLHYNLECLYWKLKEVY